MYDCYWLLLIIGLSIIYVWNHYRARKSYHFLLISEWAFARDDCIFSPTPVCSWWILCSKIKFLYFQHLAKNSLLDFSALSVTLTPVNYILRVTPLVHTTCRLRLANFINILLCRIASMLVNFASSLILFDVDPDDEIAEHSFKESGGKYVSTFHRSLECTVTFEVKQALWKVRKVCSFTVVTFSCRIAIN